MPPRTPTGSLLLVLVGLLFLLSAAPVVADPPSVIDNPDASRTVTWRFSNATGLTFQDVEPDANRLVLPWREENLTWGSPQDFASNGTLDATVIAGPTGLELASDSSDHVAGGDFSSDSGWVFGDGPLGAVTARRDAMREAALLGHNSQATDTPWDTMDDIATNWTWNAPVSTDGRIVQNTSGGRGDSARLGMSIDTSLGGTWGSALHAGSLDWSASNWLVLWIEVTDVDPPVTFNVTARVGGAFRTTPAIPVDLGWQEVQIDLAGLGTPAERTSLTELRFRVNVVGAPSFWLYFDDARLASSIKTFDEQAFVTQVIQKANGTGANPGSAYLSFDWTITNASGIRAAGAEVNLTGPSGFFEASLGGVPTDWQSFRADVSSSTALPGGYVLAFRFRVTAMNSTESHANLLLDNVSLRFPDRKNGTYLSYAIPLGTASEFVNASWSASIGEGTSARVGVRSGNGTDTAGPSWGPWIDVSDPGRFPLPLSAADHVQVRLELNTTNASVSPVVTSLSILSRHRAASGTVATAAFYPSTTFIEWRVLIGNWTGSPGTDISFEIGNGTFWTPVPSSGTLSAFESSTLHWRATLSSIDGLATPELWDVRAVYDFRGPVDEVLVTTTSLTIRQDEWLRFTAVVLDAGGHTLSVPVVWTTDDPDGEIRNDGSYRGGKIGYNNITATAAGSSISDSIAVQVLPSLWWEAAFPYPMAVVAVLGAGVVIYQLAIRRLFSIDDVFLISKDGRLMMHNTRRMRADRDEDILSAMLTAIRSFVRDADPEEDGELRRFDLGGKTTLLERGKNVFVSAVYSGRVPRWAAKDLRHFVADLEASFGPAFANWNGAREDLPDLKEMTRRFVSRVRYKSPRSGRVPLNGVARGTRDRT